MRKANVRKLILKNSKLNLINNLIVMLQETKFIIYQNENNKINSKENKKLINKINNIFISKSNCSKFNYHPLINYSIDNYEDYTLFFNPIFVELSYYKNDKLLKIERTFFHPNSQSFAVNFKNLTFVFYIYYNKVKIYLNLKEYLIIFASSDLKKIRENFIDLDSKNNINDNSISSLKINPFKDLKEKILCFSCIKKEEIIEVKFGYFPIYLDGFFETKLPISLQFYDNKDIFLEKNRLILFEIKNNCTVEEMRKIIDDKIKIFKILEISANIIYYFGIIIESKNINGNLNKSLIYYEKQNYKIYIIQINNNFLGQDITEIKQTKNNNYPTTINSKRKKTYDINQSMHLDNKTNNLLEQSLTNSHIINDSTISMNTTPSLLQKQMNKIQKNEEKKILPKKDLQRQLSYYSIFDDDFLYYQMIIN